MVGQDLTGCSALADHAAKGEEDLALGPTLDHNVAAALPEWGTHHRDPNGLDWVKQQFEPPAMAHGRHVRRE